VQESHPPSVPGAPQPQPLTSQPAKRRPQEPERHVRSGHGLFSVLVTSGLIGFALAALRALARDKDVTLEQHARLEPDMSYEAVCALVGRRGTDISVSAGSKLYAWRNRDGSRLAAVFREGRLLCYGHNGLK